MTDSKHRLAIDAVERFYAPLERSAFVRDGRRWSTSRDGEVVLVATYHLLSSGDGVGGLVTRWAFAHPDGRTIGHDRQIGDFLGAWPKYGGGELTIRNRMGHLEVELGSSLHYETWGLDKAETQVVEMSAVFAAGFATFATRFASRDGLIELLQDPDILSREHEAFPFFQPDVDGLIRELRWTAAPLSEPAMDRHPEHGQAGEERRLTEEEVATFEALDGWQRLTDEPHLRGVEVMRRPQHPGDRSGKSHWSVSVWVAEFLREDPLESELFDGMDAALAAVPGVDSVIHDDRELWVVTGSPEGQALLRAAARVVDGLSERAREWL